MRRGTQNCSYVHRRIFTYPTQNLSYVYLGEVLRWGTQIVPMYIGGFLRTPTQKPSYILGKTSRRIGTQNLPTIAQVYRRVFA